MATIFEIYELVTDFLWCHTKDAKDFLWRHMNRKKWTLSEQDYGVSERWHLSNEQMKKLLHTCTFDKYCAETEKWDCYIDSKIVKEEIDEKIYDAVASYESRPHQPASRDEIEFACIMYMINANQEGFGVSLWHDSVFSLWPDSVIVSDACERIGEFIIFRRDIHANGILDILYKCLPLEEIETFAHHWSNTNYCGCEYNESAGHQWCFVHYASELTAWIFNISGFHDNLDDDDIRVRMKNWRSQMTNAEYEAIKKYIIDDARGDARWADYIKLLDGKPSSLFDYSTGFWLVDNDGELWEKEES